MRVPARKFAAAHLSIVAALLTLSAPRLNAEPSMGGVVFSAAKGFGVSSMPVGSSTTLTFSLLQVSGSPVTTVAFTDTFPAGLIVGTPNGLSTAGCPGAVVTAVPGASSMSLALPTLASGVVCTFFINVTGTAPGLQVNTTSAVTSSLPTIPGATASITITAPVPVAGPMTFGVLALLMAGVAVTMVRRRAARIA
jgi:hypothetical protein